jgi:putative flavoprotein involved in K+ transport
VVPGLYFCGVHFMRKRKSSLLFGVGEDATVVAGQIASLSGAHARAPA